MKKKFLNTLAVIGLTLLVMIGALLMVTKIKSIYVYGEEVLHISEYSGVSRKVAMENYAYVIDYLNGDEKMKFELPSMDYSEDGAYHFYEVKQLIKLAERVEVILILILLPTILYLCIKEKEYNFLKISGVSIIVFPVILAVLVSINFEKAFTIFHKLFFYNDKWIFDPRTDPIIDILPEEFFAFCGIIILGIIIVTGILMCILHLIIRKKSNYKYRPVL